MFNVSNDGDLDPPRASKVVAIIKLGLIINFANSYTNVKQWAIMKMQDAY
jgi:hypothetical protein